MASIGNLVLAIQVNQTTRLATVTVVGQATFGSGESPLASRVDCRILGDDPVRDDFLFAFPTHFFTDLGAAQNFRFERNDVPRKLLNEDIIGADEIVGEVTLRIANVPATTRRTNVVQIR